MGSRRRIGRGALLGEGASKRWTQLTWPLQLGLLACGLSLFLLFMLLDEPTKTEEQEYLERMGDSHVAHKGFHDAPLLEKLKAVDAALHIAEAERLELSQTREKLMKEMSFNDTEDEDDEDYDTGGDESLLLYSRRALPSNLTCQSFEPGAGSACTRAPVKLTLPWPKIYIYDLPGRFNRDMAKKYKRCATDQYGTEVFFHEALLATTDCFSTSFQQVRLLKDGDCDVSELRVKTPEDATMFFVPIYGECYLWQFEMLKHESRVKSYEVTNTFFLEALDEVKKLPFWNRTDGRDHIFVFPGARGPTIFSDWQMHIRNSVYLTPEGDRKAFYFNTWKDVVIPGLEADQQFWGEESRQELVTNPPHRRYIAYFRGTIFHREGNAYSRGLRPRLHALFQNQSDIIYGTKQKDCDRKCYRQEMTESVFCLNPLGWTPWTLRFYQAVMTRCIPILIADDIEFPFESEIDYSQFALKIAEKDVDNIVQLMRGMPESEREQKRQYMDKIWKIFTYQRPPMGDDAFYATMKELARKHRVFKTSALHEWL